ncbi:Hypothetical_protein [Hexamita inflata]|uniref:Hypothetical_protein n=1 Tax=Hexamita inflata TaxID=28002 RepID=A0AA86N7C0_9EUKA|nr:Hypothetical protein HINF_LOCUS1429 [Hexamita inflata]
MEAFELKNQLFQLHELIQELKTKKQKELHSKSQINEVKKLQQQQNDLQNLCKKQQQELERLKKSQNNGIKETAIQSEGKNYKEEVKNIQKINQQVVKEATAIAQDYMVLAQNYNTLKQTNQLNEDKIIKYQQICDDAVLKVQQYLEDFNISALYQVINELKE